MLIRQTVNGAFFFTAGIAVGALLTLFAARYVRMAGRSRNSWHEDEGMAPAGEVPETGGLSETSGRAEAN